MSPYEIYSNPKTLKALTQQERETLSFDEQVRRLELLKAKKPKQRRRQADIPF